MKNNKLDTVVDVNYALINYDGIERCAWCKKPTKKIKNLIKIIYGIMKIKLNEKV